MAQVQVPSQAHRGASIGEQATGTTGSAVSPTSVSSSATADGNMNLFSSTSLYVGDLDQNISDAQLYDIFGQVGHVVSVRVCRDINTRRSLGYAYVNFSNPVDAARALDALNFTPLNGKPIRIMYSNRDPSLRKSGTANIFIKNLDKAIEHKSLQETFSVFGNILSCKVATDASGQSKGYGFVQFEQEEAAQNAIEKLNGMCLNDKPVYVGPFLRRMERENTPDQAKFNNVFVKNLAESTTEDDLAKVFGNFGKMTSLIVMRERDGKSKCFGFVNFENPDDAARAVYELNGKKFDEKEWYVGKAQKKSDREMELKGKLEPSNKENVEKYQALNLFLKNLDDNIGDEKLKDLFSEFGTITSCKVMREPNGASRGSGFVAFSTAGEAATALSEMNGKLIGSKPLYVALAQRKDERRARLQAQFSQMRPAAMPAVTPSMPMNPLCAPGMGQQLFYGQGTPALIPPQAGFGFQQQHVPGIRPGGAPIPNFFMPMLQQGHQAQRFGGRRAGAGAIQSQQPLPMMHQPQMLPRGGTYLYPPGRISPDVPNSSFTGGLPSPYDFGGLPLRDAPIPVDTMTSALANATPQQQRTILGESLYPLVDQLEHEDAAKITGMLLEMDQTEVLHLLESPEALKAKVGEAMEVLKSVSPQQVPTGPADQLSGLSLDDSIVS